MADQNQIQQIVLNLCVNARDAMPSGGSITLSTACVEGDSLPTALAPGRAYACLAVADTGTGMTPEVRARIFEPFYTTKSSEQGTGLGLAVVYGIVASHEGTIEVESATGAGSTFKIYLPLADRSARGSVIAESAEFPGGEETILIVDDEAPLRLLLEASLTSKGYHILTASDAAGAMVRIKDLSQSFDGVVLDMSLPAAGSIEVLRAVQDARPGMKAILLTGDITPEIRSSFPWIEKRNIVRKPYTIEQVGRKIRAQLERGEAAN